MHDHPASSTPPKPLERIWSLRLLAFLCVLVGLGGLGVVIWAAVSAALGLASLVVIGLAGLALIQVMPAIAERFENRVLAARKADVRRNPIEQLDRFLLQKTERAADFGRQLATIGSQIKTMRNLVAERKRRRPGYDATRLEDSIAQMEKFYEVRKKKLREAQAALAQVTEILEEKRFEHKFAVVGAKAMQSLKSDDGKLLLESILAEEALVAVRDNFNRVFAELEIEACAMAAPPSPGLSEDLLADTVILQPAAPSGRPVATRKRRES